MVILITLRHILSWCFAEMSNKKLKLIPFVILLVSLLAILLFINKKTISFGNGYDQKVIPVVEAINKQKVEISVLFVGDIMFDRYIRQVSERHGYSFPLQKVESLLKNNDMVIGNLEGPITDNQSISLDSKMGERNNYVFTFDPKSAQVLANQNIKLVNIGNNHIANFGSAGIESTRDYLMKFGINFFGDPEKSSKRMTFENINGLKIAFVNYNQFMPNARQKTFDDIDEAKNLKSDIIIIYTHWGKEFINEPDQEIKDLAHDFIDAGGDLIIGSHPHVIQPKEEYKNKMIYYSLGNFLFDQYFDSRTQEGLIVKVQIDTSSKEIRYTDYKIKMKNSGQVLSL